MLLGNQLGLLNFQGLLGLTGLALCRLRVFLVAERSYQRLGKAGKHDWWGLGVLQTEVIQNSPQRHSLSLNGQ